MNKILQLFLFILLILIACKLYLCYYTLNIKGGGSIAKNAYVMLMFGGDSYLEGIKTLAYSLIKTGTKNDIICMVTHDVSQNARNKMKKLGIKVIEVPYLKFKSKPLKSQKQADRYPWMNVSYTKLNCLNLTQYKKILFLDADMIVMKNIDHLFKRHAPASQFVDKKIFKDKKNNFGKFVTQNNIKKLLNTRQFVADASLLLLEPNKKHFEDYKKMMKTMEPFGFKAISGYDEQSICYFMSLYKKGPKKKWLNLGGQYSCNWTIDCDQKTAYILNFIGDIKPWIKDISKKFPDTLPWYKLHKEMIDYRL